MFEKDRVKLVVIVFKKNLKVWMVKIQPSEVCGDIVYLKLFHEKNL